MKQITAALLRWYDANAREMPWRGIANPYGTWVSEIMLQQTRVETVRDYYPRFMERFPTLQALAEAPEDDVLKIWEGLGYYSRARNLHQGARQVMAEYGGVIPREPEQLKRVKGIGPYTSCSIASIAFDVPVPAVDGNGIRVISRLYNMQEDPAEAKAHARIERLAAELVPAERAGDHNQAMMDLGATICTPGTPDCDHCPLREMCAARVAGTAEELPNLPKAKPPKKIDYDVLIIFSGDRVLLYRRTEKMLQGLWCFPLLEGHSSLENLPDEIRRKLHVKAEDLHPLGDAKHVFTHQVWKMKLYCARAAERLTAPKGYEWIPKSSVQDLAMPVAMKVPQSCLG